MIELPIIDLDMSRKNIVYQIAQPAFDAEDGVYLVRLRPIDYDWTDKVASIVFSAVSAPSQTLDVTDGVVSMLVNSAWVTAGLNRLQLNIYSTDGVLHEQSPIVEWYVQQSIHTTDPAPERVDIIADLIAQVATVTTSVNGIEQVGGNVTLTLDDIPDGINRKLYPPYGAIYGLLRNGASTYTRTGAADGRGFAYSSDEVMGWSDFDTCDPWQLWRVKLHFDPALPKGYEESSVEGAPGWEECTDDVFVRCPNVYMYESDNGLTGADCITYKAVSMTPFPGAWRAFSTLVDGVVYEPDYFYIAAYEMSKDASNKGRSLAGQLVYSKDTTANFLTAARATSAICCLTPDMAYEYMRIMMSIEVGTDNLQEAVDANGKKLPGFSTGIYSAGKTLLAAVANSNIISLSTANAARFAVGQSVRISSGWVTDVVDTRIIETVNNTTGEITLSGDPITCDAGLNVYNMDCVCGSADTILGHTGAKVLSDGRYAMKWRGIEQFYGGSSEAIFDLRFKLNGDNTHTTWYCPSLLKADGADAPSAEYLSTGLVSPAASGYMSNLAHAASWPQVAMPLLVAGSSTTYYGDYYYQGASDDRMVRAGASWDYDAQLGGASRNCSGAASSLVRFYAARISLLP